MMDSAIHAILALLGLLAVGGLCGFGWMIGRCMAISFIRRNGFADPNLYNVTVKYTSES